MDDHDEVSPGSQSLLFLATREPDATVRQTEEDVLRLVQAKAQAGTKDFKLMVGTMLGAGYTCGEIARKLRIHVSAVFEAEADPAVGKLAAQGRERRAALIRESHQSYTQRALDQLIEIAEDPSVNPKDRVKAAETLVKTAPELQPAPRDAAPQVSFVQNNFQQRVLDILNRPDEVVDVD